MKPIWIYCPKKFNICQYICMARCMQTGNFQQFDVRTTKKQMCITIGGTKLWNSLEAILREEIDIDKSKTNIGKQLLTHTYLQLLLFFCYYYFYYTVYYNYIFVHQLPWLFAWERRTTIVHTHTDRHYANLYIYMDIIAHERWRNRSWQWIVFVATKHLLGLLIIIYCIFLNFLVRYYFNTFDFYINV